MVNAFVTCAVNDGHATGVLVLGHSLRKTNTAHQLHVLYTEEVSNALREQLGLVFDNSSLVNVFDSNDEENASLPRQANIGLVFAKLSAWRLVDYDKAVFLEPNTLVMEGIDELFRLPELSAAPENDWPEFFNSAVFVFSPALETYRKFVQYVSARGSFNYGDQGFLNHWFRDFGNWDQQHKISRIYNMSVSGVPSWIPREDIKIYRFAGSEKPWHFLEHEHQEEDEAWDIWMGLFGENVKNEVPKDLFKTRPFRRPDTQDHRKRRLRRTLLFTIRRLVMARLSKSIAKFNELRALNAYSRTPLVDNLQAVSCLNTLEYFNDIFVSIAPGEAQCSVSVFVHGLWISATVDEVYNNVKTFVERLREF